MGALNGKGTKKTLGSVLGLGVFVGKQGQITNLGSLLPLDTLTSDVI